MDDTERFSELCDFFWRLDFPDAAPGVMHTSDLCRRRARRVFEIMGRLEALDEENSMYLASLSPEARKRFEDYRRRS